MNSINDSLENIKIIELLIIVVIFLFVVLTLEELFNIIIDETWLYVVILIYILYMLRSYKDEFKYNTLNIFSKIPLKNIILIVLVNVFFSYGLLMIFDYLTNNTTFLDFLVENTLANMSNLKMSIIDFEFIATVIIAPLSEEFIFRGVFLNRLKLFVSIPTAIIISSVLFGLLHEPGSMIAAAVFGVCMAIMYLKTNNILVPIFAHFLNNLLAEGFVFIDSGNLIFENPFVIVIFLILSIVSFYLIATSINEIWKSIK